MFLAMHFEFFFLLRKEKLISLSCTTGFDFDDGMNIYRFKNDKNMQIKYLLHIQTITDFLLQVLTRAALFTDYFEKCV